MKNSNFYIVQGWMINNLRLKGNELICYAVIYCFCQDGVSKYTGGVKYLKGWMNASEPTVLNALEGLTEKKLIKKEESGKRCFYTITKESLVEDEQITKEPLVEITKESLVDNKDINNKEIKEKGNINISQKENTRFIKPTIEEIDEYIKEKGFHFDAEQFFDHYESVNWMRGKNKLRDWKAVCRYWEHGNKKKVYEPLPTDEDKVKRFKLWMREKHSGIEFCEKPLTFDGYMRLQREYGMDEVCNQLDYIDANIGKFKKCDIELVIKQYLDKQ